MTIDANDALDADLVGQVLAGNREAFSALAERYYPGVQRLCGRLLGDPAEAQDVAQDAVLRAYLGLRRLQQPERFGAWLHAIAANLARSSLRRARPLPLDALEAPGPHGRRPPAAQRAVEQLATLRETHETIIAALLALSNVNREAVIGYYLQGYSYAELAALLSVPVSTVKSRLFKGRVQLRQRLDHLRPARLPAKEPAMTVPEHLEMQIVLIWEYIVAARSMVVLGTLAGDHYLPVRLPADEARAIEHTLKGLGTPLPMAADDPLLAVVDRLGGQVEHIVLRSLGERNYVSTLVVAQGGARQEIDLRLGEALLVAARGSLPIHVPPALLEGAGLAYEPLGPIQEPDALDPYTAYRRATSADGWHVGLAQDVLMFLTRLQYGSRTAHDLGKLRGYDWEKHLITRDVTWDGETLKAVRLPPPTVETAWLLLEPHLWDEINDEVDWAQLPEPPLPAPRSPAYPPPDPGLTRQLAEFLAQSWPGLVAAGARVAALMRSDGQLVAWQSVAGEAAARRMGLAALREQVITRHLAALAGRPVCEPAIPTYERGADFDPTLAAGAGLTSTAQAVLPDGWLFIIGFSHPEDYEWMRSVEQLQAVQAGVETLLYGHRV